MNTKTFNDNPYLQYLCLFINTQPEYTGNKFKVYFLEGSVWHLDEAARFLARSFLGFY